MTTFSILNPKILATPLANNHESLINILGANIIAINSSLEISNHAHHITS